MIPHGARVRFTRNMAEAMGQRFGRSLGTVTMEPPGSPRAPEGGVYVLWDCLREPAPAFEKDLEVIDEDV